MALSGRHNAGLMLAVARDEQVGRVRLPVNACGSGVSRRNLAGEQNRGAARPGRGQQLTAGHDVFGHQRTPPVFDGRRTGRFDRRVSPQRCAGVMIVANAMWVNRLSRPPRRDRSRLCQPARESPGSDRAPSLWRYPDQRLALLSHRFAVVVPVRVLTGDAAEVLHKGL